MISCIPIFFSGGNLGQRHQCLNNLVAEASVDISFLEVEKISEHSPLDRLYKIDLASRLKNVDYIIRNLKDNDMLYVSRALKATWLLDSAYKGIVNPNHLEDNLFPEMVSPAVSKMIHWLYINLRDPERCYEFYQHYKEKKSDVALKFLTRCSDDKISDEFPKVLPKITPHYLKIFCERCPNLAKIYFDALGVEIDVTLKYQCNAYAYQNSIMCVLKPEPDIFLDILEEYRTADLKKLGPDATKHIIRHHKNRFTAKAELYSAWLLHMPTISKYLSVEECEGLVITLARAKFLEDWFTYKVVEPLVKRLSPDRRAAFKKRVFVEKDIGECLDYWPYPIPKAPYLPTPEPHVFDDTEDGPRVFDFKYKVPKRLIKKKCGKGLYGPEDIFSLEMHKKTELDRLFDAFRFVGFEGTFLELSQRLAAAGTVDSRRNIFLVLVSKTGGREECVFKLLELMIRHINEPANFRAAIVRSLVKRACVWRLIADAWTLLVNFSHGLGLDGGPAEAECHEGLHAVVLRQLIWDEEMGPDLRKAYFRNYTDFSEYSLTTNERARTIAGLSRLLLDAAGNAEPEEAGYLLRQLFNAYKAHRVSVDGTCPIVTAAKVLAKRDADAARKILSLLYDARIARKEQFIENLQFRTDDASYINVLRHDATVLDPIRFVETFAMENERLNLFIRKLALYFNEPGGLGPRILQELQQRIADKPNVNFARLLVALSGQDLILHIKNLDMAKEDKMKRRLLIALRAYAHEARPTIDMDAVDIREIGAKAVSTRASMCRRIETEKYINKLLAWRRTVKTALLLAEKVGIEPSVLKSAASLRSVPVIKYSLRYLRRYGDCADLSVWEVFKPMLLALDLKGRRSLQLTFNCISSLPAAIRPDYCVTLYDVFSKISINYAVNNLYYHVEDLLPDMSVKHIEKILLEMLSQNEKDDLSMVYPPFFVKYLLLCKSKEEQLRRLDGIGNQFLDRITFLKHNLIKPEVIKQAFFFRILKSLKYSKVFFDTQYVNCQSVFERILAWMKTNYPVENYFYKYVEVHLTMLYHNAIRRSVTIAANIYCDPKRKMNEGVKIVGAIFGRLVAREIKELTSKYFESIIELYDQNFIRYLDKYFLHSSSTSQFMTAVMKGILEEDIHVAPRLVVYFLKEKESVLSSAASKEIKDILKEKDSITRYLLYAETCADLYSLY